MFPKLGTHHTCGCPFINDTPLNDEVLNGYWDMETNRGEDEDFQPYFYATSSQNKRKDRSKPSKLASSRGKPPLNYTNEKFLDDTNDKTSFLYIGV